jgi:hypothetical protein
MGLIPFLNIHSASIGRPCALKQAAGGGIIFLRMQTHWYVIRSVCSACPASHYYMLLGGQTAHQYCVNS